MQGNSDRTIYMEFLAVRKPHLIVLFHVMIFIVINKIDPVNYSLMKCEGIKQKTILHTFHTALMRTSLVKTRSHFEV